MHTFSNHDILPRGAVGMKRTQSSVHTRQLR